MQPEAQIDHVSAEVTRDPVRRPKLLPQPHLSALIVVIWLILAESLSPRLILLGLFYGWLIPLFTQRFFPVKPRVESWATVLWFVPLFLWDIVVANLNVARIILTPGRQPRSHWVAIPLTTRNPYTIATLANVITLTPGTVSAELGPQRKTLLVHALQSDDPDAEAQAIKDRYEKPLMEIFG